MSEERDYPVTVIRRELQRHLEDARAAGAAPWTIEAIALLAQEAAAVPAPAERSETIPTYIYPH
ncbi:hypothetical protein [Reyranella sp.]|uniref:hypothetical protein n=1 Tax=Reyranella sp. TaxID=1929291 RepID=UPI003BA8EAEB